MTIHTGGRFVVVVSRDPDICDMYVEVFRVRRIPSLSAANAQDARKLAATVPVAVVLVDVLAESEWRECAALVAEDALAGVPVVVLTGWVSADGHFRDLTAAIGCAAFIAKPCPAEVVVRIVEQVRRGERGIEVVTRG
jgi:DNA-binding response OmpR family regulator